MRCGALLGRALGALRAPSQSLLIAAFALIIAFARTAVP
jgi:hypothetical protein